MPSFPLSSRRAAPLSLAIVVGHLGLVALVAFPVAAAAQARPTQAQAEALIRERPELAVQLRERIMSSGMTPAQVRARLRAEGYSENLLDAYLDPSGSTRATPTADVFAAVRALGITDEEDLTELMALAGLRNARAPRAPADTTARGDSTLSVESARIFGLDLFQEQSSRFVPNLAGPVDAGYRLGAGDQLVLILTGEVEAAHTLDVTREGFVVVPQVGQLSVANLTLAQLEDLLYARLGRAYSSVRRGAGAATRFSVSVARLRAIQVAVAGDVVAPNAYRLSSAATALTALYAAGGPSEQGSLRRIEIRRAGALVTELDVYDYLLRGDASKDVRLEQGDLVFVRVHGARVRVDGAVTRPATYELRPGESLSDVLAAAGGLRTTADGRRVLVDRILPADDRAVGRDRASVDVPLRGDGGVPAFPLADGDIVRVPAIADRVRDRIVVKGHVWREGPQGFAAGLTLEEALARAGGLKPDAFLGRVLVSRLQPDSTRVQLRAMLRDASGATVTPFALAEDDQVTVFSRTEFRPERYVAIGGAVRKSGRFAWRDGMTMRDLVLQAGGLADGAYLGQAEIARLPEVRDQPVTATTLRVPLDSGYWFDRERAATYAGAEVPLQPFDNVLILREPGWQAPRTVQLTGEVRFPGEYTLVGREERISQLIARAGGLTQRADPDAAYFSRRIEASSYRGVRDSAAARRDATRRSGSDASGAISADRAAGTDSLVAIDAARLDPARLDSMKLDAGGQRIRVGVDLVAAMRARRGSSNDLLLEAGDSLFLPTRRQTVEVRGEVNQPTALVHAGGKGLGFYLDAAGGPTERSNARRAYVIQPNGKIESRRKLLWLITLDPTPRAGSTVVVPQRAPSQGGTSVVNTLAIVAQTLASLAAIVALTR